MPRYMDFETEDDALFEAQIAKSKRKIKKGDTPVLDHAFPDKAVAAAESNRGCKVSRAAESNPKSRLTPETLALLDSYFHCLHMFVEAVEADAFLGDKIAVSAIIHLLIKRKDELEASLRAQPKMKAAFGDRFKYLLHVFKGETYETDAAKFLAHFLRVQGAPELDTRGDHNYGVWLDDFYVEAWREAIILRHSEEQPTKPQGNPPEPPSPPVKSGGLRGMVSRWLSWLETA